MILATRQQSHLEANMDISYLLLWNMTKRMQPIFISQFSDNPSRNASIWHPRHQLTSPGYAMALLCSLIQHGSGTGSQRLRKSLCPQPEEFSYSKKKFLPQQMRPIMSLCGGLKGGQSLVEVRAHLSGTIVQYRTATSVVTHTVLPQVTSEDASTSLNEFVNSLSC